MHSLLPLRQTLPRPANFARLAAGLVSLVLLTSCATAPYQPSAPATVEAREVESKAGDYTNTDDSSHGGLTQSQTVSGGIDPESAERAQYYQQQADYLNDQNAKIEATLSSAEHYVQAGQHNQAVALVRSMDELITKEEHYHRSLIVLAYADYAEGYYQQALARLEPLLGQLASQQHSSQQLSPQQHSSQKPEEEYIDQSLAIQREQQDSQRTYIDTKEPLVPPIPLSAQQVDALLLGSFCYQSLGQHESAIASLIQRESALDGASRAETTRYIWQVIDAIPAADKDLLATQSSNALVRNRIQQSLAGEIGSATEAPSQFNQWREDQAELNTTSLSSEWLPDSPRSIYVLLPLTSRYSKAANAVKAGIQREHELNESPYKPNLSIYDIGDNPLQIGQYHAAALRAGADFIIGPIGKTYSNEANSNGMYSYNNGASTGVPLLMLGGDQPLRNGNFRLSMSPESEGQRVAERAWQDGYLSAGLLVSNSSQSQRAAAGFKQKWLALGGKLNSSIEYSAQRFDHSAELKQLFGIHKSEQRHRQLSQTLGFTPKFSPYQRGDIDFVFMASDSKSGRILRPQINFFTNSQLPVYATSSIYNGIEDKINNMDLDRTHFPVMPWVVRSGNVSDYAGQLNMLHALGMDAYRVASSLKILRANPNIAISGNTGQLQVNNSGEVIYRAAWAKFTDGELQVIDGKGLNLTPMLVEPIEGEEFGEPTIQNSNGSYNNENWNTRESRRKTGG